jgi:transposase
VVQTAEGLPIYHEVFDGNIAEVTTLRATLEKVLKRFPIRRVIAVADRGLLSVDNLHELKAMSTPSGVPLEFIVAVPGRRYKVGSSPMAVPGPASTMRCSKPGWPGSSGLI